MSTMVTGTQINVKTGIEAPKLISTALHQKVLSLLLVVMDKSMPFLKVHIEEMTKKKPPLAQFCLTDVCKEIEIKPFFMEWLVEWILHLLQEWQLWWADSQKKHGHLCHQLFCSSLVAYIF